ncbi:MAG: ferrous iron transport protein A [Methanobrevibacter sp.]|nr:ferrous iron transport protein A [Methanobrevibacter sp.]
MEEKNKKSIKRLNELKNGEKGTIVSFNDKGDEELKRHLLGMGFVKGSEITFEKTAPLGDPIKLKLKGYSICLRKNEAENIKVQLINV